MTLADAPLYDVGGGVSNAEHQRIFQAVLDRDEERAVQLLDAHLTSADSYWQRLLPD